MAAVVAMVTAAVVASAGPGIPVPLIAGAGLAAVAGLGLFKTTRRSEVRLANALLATGLPRPAAPRRLATAAWALAWAVASATLMTATLPVFIAIGTVLIWLNGGDFVTIGVDVRIPGDLSGSVTVLIAAGSLLALIYLSAAYAALMRRLATRLLGPGMAERLAAAEAEADRVADRNRLARDLHDSIGHTLTTSTIQAAVAKQLLGSDPDAARNALESIVDSSRAALDDLDRALGVLREEPASTRARPTLAELGSLRDRVSRAGTELTIDVEGDLLSVTPAVSQEAYRIVQEGVTNALKHAPGSEVRLRIEIEEGSGAGAGELRVHLSNSIVAGAGESAYGRGLTGITERVRLLGGEASAGPDGRGRGQGQDQWILRADLPLRVEDAVR